MYLRSHDVMKIFVAYAGEIGRMYEANVDDVGYRLVAVYTPIREDGVEGGPSSSSTEPIAVGIFPVLCTFLLILLFLLLLLLLLLWRIGHSLLQEGFEPHTSCIRGCTIVLMGRLHITLPL